jgi:hypothetical protein
MGTDFSGPETWMCELTVILTDLGSGVATRIVCRTEFHGTYENHCASANAARFIPKGPVDARLPANLDRRPLRRDAAVRERRRSLHGRRYVLPPPVALALERVFGEQVGGISVVEHSIYARAHLGMCATTRPNRILLAIDGHQFVSNPDLVLHEYFHVLRQWGTGRLTRWRYLVESMRYGYWHNRFEREAREFAREAGERYRQYLGEAESETLQR